jgi:hypothetical protein
MACVTKTEHFFSKTAFNVLELVLILMKKNITKTTWVEKELYVLI